MIVSLLPALTPPTPPTPPASRPRHRRAFTLLELLVVFVIIAILVGLALMVGQKVVGGSKIKSTQNALQTLDQAVTAYTSAKGGTAAKFPERFLDVAGNEFPLADASETAGGNALPSCELAVELMLNEPSAAAILKGLPAEFVLRPTAGQIAGATPQRAVNGANQTIVYTQVKDAWGRPIRFVHPAYHGIYNAGRAFSVKRGSNLTSLTLFRSWNAVTGGGTTTYDGTGDGGLCAGGRPYFYSAGPDGNPATVEDNVYSVRPTFDTKVKAGGQ